MQEKAKKLSIFTYLIILSCLILITVLVFREFGIISYREFSNDILYQKDVDYKVEQENKNYVKKIKNEYGITILYGESEVNFLKSVDANVQYDENIVNNNLKLIDAALKKYPKDVFDIFKEEKYNLYVMLVSNFNDNNIALASKNTLNQYRIFLSNNPSFEKSFHHEFFHILEYYMSNHQKYLYYSWNSYNPYEFRYEADIMKLDNNYVYDKSYNKEDENIYFVSKYSKVSEKEDRAEIFSELMTLNNKIYYLEKGNKIREKIDYLLNEIYENITIDDFHFSIYLEP